MACVSFPSCTFFKENVDVPRLHKTVPVNTPYSNFLEDTLKRAKKCKKGLLFIMINFYTKVTVTHLNLFKLVF